MTEYLITFNDEWVPAHSPEQSRAKAGTPRTDTAGGKWRQ